MIYWAQKRTPKIKNQQIYIYIVFLFVWPLLRKCLENDGTFPNRKALFWHDFDHPNKTLLHLLLFPPLLSTQSLALKKEKCLWKMCGVVCCELCVCVSCVSCCFVCEFCFVVCCCCFLFVLFITVVCLLFLCCFGLLFLFGVFYVFVLLVFCFVCYSRWYIEHRKEPQK